MLYNTPPGIDEPGGGSLAGMFRKRLDDVFEAKTEFMDNELQRNQAAIAQQTGISMKILEATGATTVAEAKAAVKALSEAEKQKKDDIRRMIHGDHGGATTEGEKEEE